MKINVEFSVKLPVPANEKQIAAWLRYELGETAKLRLDNPLAHTDLKALRRSVKITETTA